MTIIAPSILASDFGCLRSEIQSVENSGADWIHIDVMDGSFVPPITFGDNVVRIAAATSKLFRDVHLMVQHPESFIDDFVGAGANQITFHLETSANAHRLLGAIRKRGLKAGLALNPGTPVATANDLLDLCDLVLIMTVNPGWGGQEFITRSIERVRELKKEISRRSLLTKIEVDGGINAETGRQCVRAGADVLVAGTYIFKAADRAAAITSLR